MLKKLFFVMPISLDVDRIGDELLNITNSKDSLIKWNIPISKADLEKYNK